MCFDRYYLSICRRVDDLRGEGEVEQKRRGGVSTGILVQQDSWEAEVSQVY